MAREYLHLHNSIYKNTSLLSDAEFGRLIRSVLIYLITDHRPEPAGNERFVLPFLIHEIDRED
ncbi:MAG: hypothetical protein GX222_04455 [Ruminococcaceae bacterium]|nr:hypothetical protein [Oscillospiraceae bacterium]